METRSQDEAGKKINRPVQIWDIFQWAGKGGTPASMNPGLAWLPGTSLLVLYLQSYYATLRLSANQILPSILTFTIKTFSSLK